MVDPVSVIADTVVTNIVEVANSFIKNKYHELYGVESEIVRLSSKMSAIQAVLEDAERCLADSNSKHLLDWFTKLRDVALDVEDVLETYATEAALREKHKLPSPLAWLHFRSKAASKIKEVLGRMNMISEEKRDFHFRESDYVSRDWRPRPIRDGFREMSFLRDISDIIGRDKEKEEIVSWLVSDEGSSVLPIVGMGGLGKTTLVQLVYNDERIYKKYDERCHFKVAMWVNVSVNSSVDRILKEMIEILTEMRHDMIPRSTIQSRILEVLDGKRFLLVLDDVWPEKLDWEPLQEFLKLCPQGSKVLVTSRNSNVAKIMHTQTTKTLGYLPEEDCWKLFAKRAFISTEYPRELEEIGRDIIRRCNFLPLAVKAIAGLLYGHTDEHRWRRILKNGVWESDRSNLGNETPNILPALKLSYDHLPSQLKQCFSYCCIFPKGYMFEKGELVKLWIAEGYIQFQGEDKIEDLGSDYFDELLTRSFFQLLDVDNKERYKMHDLIHDMAKFVSSCCQQLTESTPVSIASNTRHVSFLGKDAQEAVKEIAKAKKLRTLLLPTPFAKDFGQTLDKMFRTLSYLRVLDLNSSAIKELPKSVGELKLLRYLDLSRTEIRLLPSTICNLQNLQILRLLGCLWLLELPKDLGNLKSLRYLELDEIFWYKCSTLPPGIGSLSNLHNLHSFHVRQDSGYGIEELKSMKNLEGVLLISKLENSEDAKSAKLKQKECIHKLVLEWSDKEADPNERTVQERVVEDLEPHHRLQELHMNHFKGNRFPSWLGNGMLSKIRKISLTHCTHSRILSLGQLPTLSELFIKGMLELIQWPETIYPSLTRLSISNCPKLNELPHIIPNLRVAKIKQCDALTALPVMPSLTFLQLINNALLEDWHERPVGNATRNNEGNEVITLKGSYMDLLELKIINCPRLQPLPRFFFPQKLEISACNSLTTLPIPQHSLRLQCLALDRCNGTSLIETIPSTSSLYSLIISNINDLAALPQFPHLTGLKALHINSCEDLVILSNADGLLRNLNSLKILSVSGCKKLETFPNQALPTSIECLIIKDCPLLKSFQPGNCLASTSLKDLYLEGCPSLESLPADGLPTSLQHLCIRGCPILEQNCSEGRPIVGDISDLEVHTTRTPEPQGSIHTNQKLCFACFKA